MGVFTYKRMGDLARLSLARATSHHLARPTMGMKRFLLGSVSEAVATHARCSVEVIRPGSL